MEPVIAPILSLAFLAGLAAAFALICNYAFKRSSPAKRAGIAASAVGLLFSIPGAIALLATDSPLWVVFTLPIFAIILAAMCFPVALLVTRRSPAQRDDKVFD